MYLSSTNKKIPKKSSIYLLERYKPLGFVWVAENCRKRVHEALILKLSCSLLFYVADVVSRVLMESTSPVEPSTVLSMCSTQRRRNWCTSLRVTPCPSVRWPSRLILNASLRPPTTVTWRSTTCPTETLCPRCRVTPAGSSASHSPRTTSTLSRGKPSCTWTTDFTIIL